MKKWMMVTFFRMSVGLGCGGVESEPVEAPADIVATSDDIAIETQTSAAPLAGTVCPTQVQFDLCATWANAADFAPCGIFLWWGDRAGWEACIYAHLPPWCWACTFFPIP